MQRLPPGRLLSPAARPLRFAGTGGVAGATQILLLTLLTGRGWDPLPADIVALLIATQVNFALSLHFTWRDRSSSGALLTRWLLFHGSVAVTMLLNVATFAAVRPWVPALAASAAGIAAGALGNYVAGDRLVFRQRSASDALTHERRYVA